MCPWKWTALGLALCVLLAAASCQDPTVESAIAALGPEDRGVSPGPLHRPGQPCVLCHGDGGTARTFVVAGTIYRDKGRPTVAPGAKVLFLDADGHGFTAEANCAGNFYVEPRQWAPRFPLWVTLAAGNYTIDMESRIFRDGSCASCHFEPAGPASAGAVFLTDDPLAQITLPAVPCGAPR